MSEENSDLFSHSNTNPQNSNHDENNVSDTRRTRSGQIYVCLSMAVQETDPLFLHPSLTTLNYDMCKTKNPAGEGEISQPTNTGEILKIKPASDFSPK